MSLSNVLKILNSIDYESSRKEKEKIIKNNKDNEDFKNVIIYALDQELKFKTKSVYYIKNDEITKKNDNKLIFNYLDYLNSKRGITDNEKDHLSYLSSIDKETVEVVNRIVNKDLKCGASIKTFKKYFELNSFGVMLAIPFKQKDKFLKNANYDKEKLNNIVWSIKLDGVRCVSYIYENNTVEYKSRNGLNYDNFFILNDELIKYAKNINKKFNLKYPIILDGEITLINNKYQSLMTQIRRIKEINPNYFIYNIFDIILDNFDFEKRYNIISESIDKQNFNKIKLVKHYNCNNMNSFEDIVKKGKEAVSAGYEGLVIKTKNNLYEKKKSNNWLKIKFKENMDVEVVRLVKGTPGSKYELILGAFECRLPSGKIFYCGSGIDDDDRIYFLSHPPKMIEIEYQELTQDNVPRFPVFVRVRDDKYNNY